MSGNEKYGWLNYQHENWTRRTGETWFGLVGHNETAWGSWNELNRKWKELGHDKLRN